MRRALILIAAVTLCGATPGRAEAWGFDVHRYILARAIPLLPAEIRPFFEKFKAQVVEHAIDPDLWRTAGWEQEPQRHFMDLDAYGPYPFTQLPREYDEAVRRYGAAFVEKNGTVPWRTHEIYGKLVEAFAQKAQYSRENIKFFSSVIGHYGSDAHVPFHAALNYDGQLTGQRGIHSRFETELFLRYQDRLNATPGPLVKVANARTFVFDALIAGFRLVQPVLDADKAAVQGRDEYDDAYFDKFFAKVQPILERRLAESISGVASLIAAAWTDAGRPPLPVEERRIPRKVGRP
jgi:hypothetical protein